MKKQIIKIFNNFFENTKYSGFIIGVFSCLIIIPLGFTNVYKSLELKLFDARFSMKPSIEEWDKLYFIDIDDNSTAALGQFPWTRDIYARGMETLKDLGASMIALDIMFPDPSPVMVNMENFNRIRSKLNKDRMLKTASINAVLQNNDEIFARGIAENGTAAISYTFSTDELPYDEVERRKTSSFQRAKKQFEDHSSIKVSKKDMDKYLSLQDEEIKSLVYPIPGIMEAGHVFGFVNRFTDIDGTIRKVRLVRLYKGRLYFNLSLAMLIKTCNVQKKNIVVNPGKKIILKQAFDHRKQRFRDIEIPIDEQGMIYVNWAGPGPREKSFKILPFFALLEYPEFADGVYDLFEERFGAQWIQKSSEINGKVQELYGKYSAAKDDDRLSIYSQIQGELKKLKKLKVGFLKQFMDEKKELEKQYDKEKSPEMAKQIESLDETIKAIDLVIRTEELTNKVAIVGLTATGTHDIASIPIHNEYPAVGTYLNTINTIINDAYIKKPGKGINLVLIVLIALLTGIVIQRLEAKGSLIVGVTLFILLNSFMLIIFIAGNIWIDQLGTNLALLIPSISLISFKLLKEENDKKFIKNAFSRYLAPDYIEQIIKNPDLLQLGGQSEVITTFFSDVAGFSTLSEGLSPAELVLRLNEYLQEMTDIIISHGGTVDKYEGDAIMAFYGAPIPYDDHQLRACLAAIDMKTRLRELQEQWREQGKQELFVRMGMNTGEAIVGNMGSGIKMDYTAMGDSVNLASRLEGANKVYSTVAMISENTNNAVKDDVETRELDIIKVVGKNEPTAIFELLGRKGSLPDKVYDCLDHYQKGLDLFRKRQWKKALKSFQEALKILPDDGPSKTYVARCEEFMKKPPSQKWDGIYTMKSK